METHPSVFAQRIPGMGEPVGCHLCGRTESDTTEVTQQQQQHTSFQQNEFQIYYSYECYKINLTDKQSLSGGLGWPSNSTIKARKSYE